MDIVHQGISDVGGGQRGRELRLPNAFREPRAGRTLAKMFFNVLGEQFSLLELVFRGNTHQDGLVKAATDHLDLAAGRQRPQSYEILGMICLNPGQKRTGIMQTQMNAGVLLQGFDKEEIATLVALFKNMLEIAARLVRMDDQDEMKFLGHLAERISQKTSYLAAKVWHVRKLRAVGKEIGTLAEEA